MLRDLVSLEDIRNAARRAMSYVSGMNRASFLADNKTRAAVVRELEVMGEAASRVSQRFRDEHALVAWDLLIQLRNFYIHVYDAVNYSKVWTTVTRTVPRIERAISSVIPADSGLDES